MVFQYIFVKIVKTIETFKRKNYYIITIKSRELTVFSSIIFRSFKSGIDLIYGINKE